MFLFKLALLHASRSTRGLYTRNIKYNFECSFNKSIVKSGFIKLQQRKRKLPSFDERKVRTEKRRKYATFHNLSGRLLFIDLSIA